MLVTNVIKREYPFTVRRKRDGEIMTMLITAEASPPPVSCSPTPWRF